MTNDLFPLAPPAAPYYKPTMPNRIAPKPPAAGHPHASFPRRCEISNLFSEIRVVQTIRVLRNLGQSGNKIDLDQRFPTAVPAKAIGILFGVSVVGMPAKRVLEACSCPT